MAGVIGLPTNFDEVFGRGVWQEIPGCPGRYVLRSSDRATIGDLIGCDAPVQQFRVPGARDEVHVVAFKNGGGLISYRRPNGTFLHTLNTSEGLQRKLRRLDIVLAG